MRQIPSLGPPRGWKLDVEALDLVEGHVLDRYQAVSGASRSRMNAGAAKVETSEG
jgi:hypothetical protein